MDDLWPDEERAQAPDSPGGGAPAAPSSPPEPDPGGAETSVDCDPGPDASAGDTHAGIEPEEGSVGTDLAAGGGELARLAELFEERLAYDRFKEEQITRLHEELQDHRRDLLGRALRPLLAGLIRIHDELDRARESTRTATPEELTPERVAGLLEGFQDDVVLLLDQHGVARTESPGDRFEPRLQTAVRRIPTADEALVGRIARRLRPGFVSDGTPLKKERVEVFVAEADASPTTSGGAGSPASRETSQEEPR